jgi:hypothetical protein
MKLLTLHIVNFKGVREFSLHPDGRLENLQVLGLEWGLGVHILVDTGRVLVNPRSRPVLRDFVGLERCCEAGGKVLVNGQSPFSFHLTSPKRA